MKSKYNEQAQTDGDDNTAEKRLITGTQHAGKIRNKISQQQTNKICIYYTNWPIDTGIGRDHQTDNKLQS